VLHRRHLRGGQKGGRAIGKTKRGKGAKLMALADRAGFPVSVCAASASPHEVTLVGETLEARFAEEKPGRLIGDRAYDSDPLDAWLKAEGIEMIAPHREKQKEAEDPRRGQASALQEALEGRAALRLAFELPAAGRALREAG
jgi:hypothetical protein